MHNDPEYAREALAYEDEHGDQSDQLWTPAWSEFDLTAEILRDQVNLLRAIGEGLGVLAGGRPFPAPATALDALKQQIADRDTAMLIAHMLGR